MAMPSASAATKATAMFVTWPPASVKRLVSVVTVPSRLNIVLLCFVVVNLIQRPRFIDNVARRLPCDRSEPQGQAEHETGAHRQHHIGDRQHFGSCGTLYARGRSRRREIKFFLFHVKSQTWHGSCMASPVPTRTILSPRERITLPLARFLPEQFPCHSARWHETCFPRLARNLRGRDRADSNYKL